MRNVSVGAGRQGLPTHHSHPVLTAILLDNFERYPELADYRALEETAYLLRSPANVKRLVESLQQAKSGDIEEHQLDR